MGFFLSLLGLSKQASDNNLEVKHKMSGKVDGEVQMSLAFVQGKELTKVTKHFTIQVQLQTLLMICKIQYLKLLKTFHCTGRSFL